MELEKVISVIEKRIKIERSGQIIEGENQAFQYCLTLLKSMKDASIVPEEKDCTNCPYNMLGKCKKWDKKLCFNNCRSQVLLGLAGFKQQALEDKKIDDYLKVAYYGEAYGQANRGEFKTTIENIANPIKLGLTYNDVKMMVHCVLKAILSEIGLDKLPEKE